MAILSGAIYGLKLYNFTFFMSSFTSTQAGSIQGVSNLWSTVLNRGLVRYATY